MLTELPLFPVAKPRYMPKTRPYIDPLGRSWWAEVGSLTSHGIPATYRIYLEDELQATLDSFDCNRSVAGLIRARVDADYQMLVLFGDPPPSDPPKSLADILRLRPGALTPHEHEWRLDLGRRGAWVAEPGAAQFILQEYHRHG